MILGLVEGIKVPKAQLKVISGHLLEAELNPKATNVVDDGADEMALPRVYDRHREGYVIFLKTGSFPRFVLKDLGRNLSDDTSLSHLFKCR